MPSANNSARPAEQRVQMVIESRLDAVPLLGRMIGAVCESAGLSPEDRDMVGLCLAEAANNSILHAYHEDPGNTISVEVTLCPEKMIIDVVDFGTSADPAVMNADHRAALDEGTAPHSLQESGRGLAIMQEIMDSFEYTSRVCSNRLRLIKRFERKHN